MRAWGGKRLLAVFLICGALACSSEQSYYQTLNQSQTACQAGQAQIMVGDGYFQNLCGCQEQPGITAPPAVFKCTVPVNTSVTFLFLINIQKHELVPQAGSPFAAGPISDPSDDLPTHAFAQTFSTAGSYPFVDVFNSTLTGTIVAF